MSTLPLLIEAETLREHLRDRQLLIIDTSSAENYARHHVPGAVHLEPAELQCGIRPAVGKLPSPQQLSALFSRVGLSPDRHVVVYDDEGGGWAGRLIWTLDVLGHHRYSYLNGGLAAWVNEGHPCEVTANPGTPTHFEARIDSTAIASLDEVMAQLGKPDCAIWDARSADEYAGRRVAALRGGHIPGAVNIDWLELMDRKRNLRLVDLPTLQQRLDALGITRDKLVITHCQTHHRSGLSYLALKLLGYPRIKGYDGSWGEWGNHSDTPIEV